MFGLYFIAIVGYLVSLRHSCYKREEVQAMLQLEAILDEENRILDGVIFVLEAEGPTD